MEEWWGVEVAAMKGGNTEGEEREISVEMVGDGRGGGARGLLTAAPSRLPNRGALDF